MSKNHDLTYQGEFFTTELDDKILRMYFRSEKLLHTNIIPVRDELLNYLNKLSKSEEIRIVLLFCNTPLNQLEEFYLFYEELRQSESPVDRALRMYRALDQLILGIINSDKFFISVNCGLNITLFFNISLACDYRVIANDWSLKNTHTSLGLIPKGGGIYFLNQLVGPAKTRDILILNSELSADKALQMGIVDKILPLQNLEDNSIQLAKSFLHHSLSTLKGFKQLKHFLFKDLKDFLEEENLLLAKLLNRTDQWGKIFDNFSEKKERE